MDNDPKKAPFSSLIGSFQKTFVSFSLWWLLPIILILLSLFVIRKHSLFLSTFMVVMTCFGIVSVAFFWYQQQKLIGRDESVLKSIRSKYFVFVTCFVMISFALNVLAFRGRLPGQEYMWQDVHDKHANSEKKVLCQYILSFWLYPIRYIAFADLSGKTITIKPSSDENETDSWIELDKRHFEGANLYKATLTKASLKEAYLDNAVFRSAKLAGVNLDYAQANGADFNNSNLENASLNFLVSFKSDFSAATLKDAKFNHANIKGSNFGGADLSGATFNNAELEGAIFNGADLSNASLMYASVKKAKFKHANLQSSNFNAVKELQVHQLEAAKNYRLAFYDSEWIDKLKLPFDHNDRVKQKQFSQYDFDGANLNRANLSGADVRGAIFRNANLSYAVLHKADMRDAVLYLANLRAADLTGITYTKYEQFARVKTLYKAKMDIELENELKRRYPNLFINPEISLGPFPSQKDLNIDPVILSGLPSAEIGKHQFNKCYARCLMLFLF